MTAAGSDGRIEAVLVCGGRWHDFDYARLQLLAALGEHRRVRTRVYEDYACADALAQADLLVTYTCDRRPDPTEQRRLAAFVDRGGRWLALHGSNAAIEPAAAGLPKLFSTPRAMGIVPGILGSQFLGHPPIAPYTVQVSQPQHPLVEGIAPFTVADELYVSELHPPLDVLLHADFSGACRGFAEGATTDDAPRPVLYLKRTGHGTVCYFTLGHARGRFDLQDLGVEDLGREDRGSWESQEFRTVLERCLAWAVYGVLGTGPVRNQPAW